MGDACSGQGMLEVRGQACAVKLANGVLKTTMFNNGWCFLHARHCLTHLMYINSLKLTPRSRP